MRVVIMGGRDRSEKMDYRPVKELLEKLKKRYPSLLVVSTGCDRGVGKIVHNLSIPELEGQPPQIDFVEYSLKMYVAQTRSKQDQAAAHMAKNAALAEYGDEFHIFLERKPMGMATDLKQRCEELSKPHALYEIGHREPKYVNWVTPL